MIYGTNKAKNGEVIGNTDYDHQVTRVEGLVALRDSWIQAFHGGGPRDIVYVAKLQQRIRALRKNLDR